MTRVEAHVKAIGAVKKRADREELDRAFIEDMGTDFRDLKDELRFAKGDAFISKDFVTLAAWVGTTAAAAALFGDFSMSGVVGVSGSAVSLLGVLGGMTKLSKSRREIMRKHPMAYLYELKR